MDVVQRLNTEDRFNRTQTRAIPQQVNVHGVGDKGLLCEVRGALETVNTHHGDIEKGTFDLLFIVDVVSRSSEQIDEELADYIKHSIAK